MIRVLQCVNNMHRAGLETMLMNYYRNIDRTKIQFDFLMHRSERSDYDDEIESMGGRIFRAPRLYPQNYPAYFSYMKKFFSEYPEYKIVHSHIDSMSFLPLSAAKRAGVPVRISHSHNTSIDKDFKYPLKQIFRYGIPCAANYYLACGQEAGNFLFRGRSFKVIANAIDADDFIFDPELRKRKREELGLQNRFVVGHVGRFAYAKNHDFIINIFSEVLKKDNNAVLMLVGTGENEQKIKDKVKSLGIEQSVRFMGSRSDVKELYQAMDAFLMPSLFEGIPMVGIEAQFSSLPCLFSDKVPKEVGFTDNFSFVSLNKSAEEWAELVLAFNDQQRTELQTEYNKYDIHNACHILEDYYVELYEQVK